MPTAEQIGKMAETRRRLGLGLDDKPLVKRNRKRGFSGEKIGTIRLDEKGDLKITVEKKKKKR